MGWDVAQVHSRTGDNSFGFILRTGEPAEISFSLKHLPKRIPRLAPKRFKQVRRKLAHVLKHAGAMPADKLNVRNGSEANLEIVRHKQTFNGSSRTGN